MQRRRFAISSAVTHMQMDDGTVHHRIEYFVKPLSERVYEWTLRTLWGLVGAVLVATAFTL